MKKNILKVLLFLSVLLVSSCDDTSSPDPGLPPNPIANTQEKLFGYYGSAMEFVGAGNYTSEMPGHANYTYIHSFSYADRLREAQQHKLRAFLSISNLIFDSNFRLHAKWKEYLVPLFNAVRTYRSTVLSFYVLDEPFMNARNHGVSDDEMFNSLEGVGSYLKENFPDIPISVIFSGSEIKYNLRIPPTFDWFGLDCYGNFNDCEGTSVPGLYRILETKLLEQEVQDKKRRQLMVVPPTGYPNKESNGEAATLEKFQQYRDWLKYRHDIHIVMGFIWQSVPSGDDPWTGTRDSAALKEKWRQFFEDFIKGPLQ